MTERLDDEILRLYRRSRELWLVDRREEAEIIYRSLRRDHSVELGPWVELPTLMRFVHPLCSVLGRATYADGLVCYQGVSVGSTVDGERPTFKGPCVLFPHSSVIGKVVVGANVWISAHTKIEALPGQTIEIEPWSVVHQIMQAKMRNGLEGLFTHEIVHATRRTARSVMERYFPEATA